MSDELVKGAPISAVAWQDIVEQHEQVKLLEGEVDNAKEELKCCKNGLEKAQTRLSMLIEKANSGQTALFNESPPEEEPS